MMGQMEEKKSLDAVKLNEAEAEVLESTQSRLDTIFSGENDTQAEETDSTPEAKPEVEEEVVAKAEEVESTPVSKTVEKENTEEVSLPDASYRAAIHQGWKPEEIKGFFEAQPELAIQTFGKICESTNKLSDDFANIGRAKLKPADTTTVAQTVTEANAGKKVDLAALKEEYGADSTIVKFAEDLQASIPAPTVSTGQSVQNQPTAQPQTAQLDPRVEVMVNQFFTADTLKPYEDFYGKGKDINNLTLQQNKNRWAVLDRADDIASGAAKMGRPVTPDEAMDLAHMLISADVQKQAVRAELKATIQKRAKGLSLKPAKNKTVAPVTDAKTAAADLEAKVEAGMLKIGLK